MREWGGLLRERNADAGGSPFIADKENTVENRARRESFHLDPNKGDDGLVRHRAAAGHLAGTWRVAVHSAGGSAHGAALGAARRPAGGGCWRVGHGGRAGAVAHARPPARLREAIRGCGAARDRERSALAYGTAKPEQSGTGGGAAGGADPFGAEECRQYARRAHPSEDPGGIAGAGECGAGRCGPVATMGGALAGGGAPASRIWGYHRRARGATRLDVVAAAHRSDRRLVAIRGVAVDTRAARPADAQHACAGGSHAAVGARTGVARTGHPTRAGGGVHDDGRALGCVARAATRVAASAGTQGRSRTGGGATGQPSQQGQRHAGVAAVARFDATGDQRGDRRRRRRQADGAGRGRGRPAFATTVAGYARDRRAAERPPGAASGRGAAAPHSGGRSCRQWHE
eukprot:ctg_2427.g552